MEGYDVYQDRRHTNIIGLHMPPHTAFPFLYAHIEISEETAVSQHEGFLRSLTTWSDRRAIRDGEGLALFVQPGDFRLRLDGDKPTRQPPLADDHLTRAHYACQSKGDRPRPCN